MQRPRDATMTATTRSVRCRASGECRGHVTAPMGPHHRFFAQTIFVNRIMYIKDTFVSWTPSRDQCTLQGADILADRRMQDAPIWPHAQHGPWGT